MQMQNLNRHISNGNIEFYINGVFNQSFPDKYPDRPMYLEAVFYDVNKKVENLYIYKEVLKTHDTIQTTEMVAKVDGYKRGFNGQERVDEVSGKGNSYTAEFWQYDNRLGRRWNLDPKPNVSISPYVTFANNPILFSDPLGDTIRFIPSGGISMSDYEKSIQWLKTSKLFSIVFEFVNSQSEDYFIVVDKNIEVGGGQNDYSNRTITLKKFDEYVLAQELFHAFQNSIGVYDRIQDHSVIETEGDLMSEYIANETKPGLGYSSVFVQQGEEGGWAEDILKINGERLDNPTNKQIQSQEYVDLFKEAVNKRIEYFKEEGAEYKGYTTPNSGKGPEAIQRVFNEGYGEK